MRSGERGRADLPVCHGEDGDDEQKIYVLIVRWAAVYMDLSV